jgi:hypothetical protein
MAREKEAGEERSSLCMHTSEEEISVSGCLGGYPVRAPPHDLKASYQALLLKGSTTSQ